MRRRGFTLVEVAVFSAVALMVLAGVWSFFQGTMRQSKATDTKVQGLQEVLLYSRLLEGDLAHLYEDDEYHMYHQRLPKVGVVFRFYRYHPDASKNPGSTWGPLPLQQVEYRYLAKKRKILRSVDGGPGRALFGNFESQDFWDPQGEEDSPPGSKIQPGPSLSFYVVSSPLSELRKKLEKRNWRSRTTLFGGVSRERRSVERRFPYWHRIPYYPSPLKKK
jgi:hypothetical protein